MRAHWRRLSGITGILLLLLSCAALEDLIQKPTIAFQTVDLTDASFSQATLAFRFTVKNPNPIGFSITGADYDLKLNQKAFLKGTLDQGISLPASGEAPLTIPFEIQYFDFFKTVKEFLKQDSLAYDLKGAVAVGPFSIPYSASGRFAVPRLPEISLKNIEVKQINLSGASLNFVLDVRNKNEHTIKIADIGYDIKLSDVSIASGNTGVLDPTSAHETSRVNIPLKVSFLELGRSAYQALTGGKTDFEITGNVGFDLPKAGVKHFPFYSKGRVSLK